VPVFVLEFLTPTQTATAQIIHPNTSKNKVQPHKKKVVYKVGDRDDQAYDFSKGKFPLGAADTQGAWSLIEIMEEPGYKTPLHRHINWNNSFCVLAGTLTAKIADTI